MDPTLLEQIFESNILRINDVDTDLGDIFKMNEFILAKGTEIFRSGEKNEFDPISVDVQENGKTKKKIVGWKYHIEAKKIPVFFSNQYVAATYATKENYLYRFEVQDNFRLCVVNEEFIKKVIKFGNQYKQPKNPYEQKIFQVCYTFYATMGKNIDDKENVINFRTKILEGYEYISLKEMENDKFNRVSTTTNDVPLFNAMLQIVNDYFKEGIYSGFYCPPFNAGQFNKTHILGPNSVFPQEIFLPSIQLQNIGGNVRTVYTSKSFYSDEALHPGYKYQPEKLNDLNTLLLTNMERLDLNNPEVYDNIDTKIVINEFSKVTTPSLIKYIASLQLQYEEIASNFLSYVEESFKIVPTPAVDEDFQDPADMAAQKQMLDTVKPTLEKAILSNEFQIVLLAELLELVQKGLSMDVTLFQNMPLKQANPEISGPFHDEAGFNENLFLYSVLNNMLKQNVVGLNKLFKQSLVSMYIPLDLDTKDSFKAVISGGALFGLYTYGNYRRQTKDIDLKIILESDTSAEPRDQSLYIYTNQQRKMYFEKLHLIPTMITAVWGILSTEIFSNLAGYKVDFFKKYLLEHPVFELPAKHKNVATEAYSFYLGVKPTVQKPNPEMLIFDYIKFVTNEDVASAWILWFNEVLKNPKKNDGTQIFPEGYKSFYNGRKYLFEQRKAAKISKNNATKLKINEQLKNFKKGIVGVIGSKGCQDFFIANKILINNPGALKIIIDSVPSFVQNVRLNITLPTGDNPYFKAGDFASLDIVVNNDKKNRDYGLIDYTYDSRYLTIGSFQKSSGLIHNGYYDINEIPYASAYHFIYESNKLNTICKRGYPFEAMFVGENNPFNACAPNPENRVKKAAKYANRYERVLNYINTIFSEVYPNLDTFINNRIEKRANRDSQIKMLSEIFFQKAKKRQGAEYFIGAGRKRKQTRRRKQHKARKTRGRK